MSRLRTLLPYRWNGPEWFHMIQENEPDTVAPGNCPSESAPNCPNGFKYRVELKLNESMEKHGYSLLRRGGTGTIPLPSSPT